MKDDEATTYVGKAGRAPISHTVRVSYYSPTGNLGEKQKVIISGDQKERNSNKPVNPSISDTFRLKCSVIYVSRVLSELSRSSFAIRNQPVPKRLIANSRAGANQDRKARPFVVINCTESKTTKKNLLREKWARQKLF